MIDRLKNWSEHVSDEAVTTAQLLNDAAGKLTEAHDLVRAMRRELTIRDIESATIVRAGIFLSKLS